MSYPEIKKKLNALFEAKVALRADGVLRSERITGEIGEWFAEKAYDGNRAQATSNKGWDIIQQVTADKKERLQVKAHAKGRDNNARWTEVNPDRFDNFNRLIIVVMGDDYLIKEWYDIPSKDLKWLSVKSGGARIVNWDDANEGGFKKNISELPNGKSLSEFIAVDDFSLLGDGN